MRAGLLCVLLLALGACRQYQVPEGFIELPHIPAPVAVPADQLAVHFLGTAGLYLQSGDASLLLDPFFSNPPIWSVLWPFSPVRGNAERIDAALAKLPALDSLKAILITHSHYDHAMDLPHILTTHAPAVPVYGNRALQQALAPILAKVIDVATIDSEAQVLAGRFRIVPVRAEHLPHLFGFTYASGDYRRATAPSRLYHWRMGESYAYLIDLLAIDDSREVLYRLFVLPSATRAGLGKPPLHLFEDGKAIDLAVLGAAQWRQAEDFPAAILAGLAVHKIMLVHWDDFFDGYRSNTPRLNPSVNPQGLSARLQQLPAPLPVYWPQRGAILTLPLPD